HSYGYGWDISENDRKEKVIGHDGGNGYFMDTMTMLPEKDVVVIVSTNRNPKNTNVITERIDRLMFENLEVLDEAFIEKFSGQYVLPSGAKVPISFNENDEAVLVLNNPEPWKLFGGSDSDQAQDMEKFNQKSAKLLDAVKAKDTATAASLSGWTAEE